jgi:hypothetical protein
MAGILDDYRRTPRDLRHLFAQQHEDHTVGGELH